MPDPRKPEPLDPAAVLDAVRRMTDRQRHDLAELLSRPVLASALGLTGPLPSDVTVHTRK
jgi:hypothetical protein